ncbi:hypothetical protein HNR27_000412 [Ornithinibacillus bavariensis]
MRDPKAGVIFDGKAKRTNTTVLPGNLKLG